MSPKHSRRELLRTGSAPLLILIAGCASGENTSPSPTSNPSPTSTETADSTEASSPTSTTVGTASDPFDLYASNRTDTSRTLSLHVSRQGTSESVFEETITLEAGGRQKWDIFSTEDSGTYVITARLDDDAEQSYEWDLDEQPEDGSVLIYLDEDGTLSIGYGVP